MELDEFRVGDDRAGARRHAETGALRFRRVGGHGVKVADAAGGEDHRAGRETGWRRRLARGRATMPTTRRPSISRRSPTKPSSTRIDGVLRTAATSAAMIAAPAMSPRTWTTRRSECAASRDILSWPWRSLVEGHAISQEVVDAGGGVRGHQPGDLLVDGAGAGGDRVGDVLLGRVARGHGGGDPALRPRRRGPLADRRGGEHGHRPRREAQGAEQAGEPAAEDDEVVAGRLANAEGRREIHAGLRIRRAPSS